MIELNSAPHEILAAAISRLNIKTTQAPEFFGVTRQTLARWLAGESKIPPAAFMVLVAIENEIGTQLDAQAARIEERAAALRDIATALNAGRFPAPGQIRNRRRNQRDKRNSI